MNAVRAHTAKQIALIAQSRIGRVTSYDPKKYACKVLILPEGDFPVDGDSGESGWIPVQTSWSGDGWGMYCPPSIDDQVFISHVEGDHGSGQIIGRVFDAAHVPAEVQSGEMWMVHKLGAFIKLTNDGKVTFNDKANTTIVMNADGTLSTTSSGVTTINANTIKLKGGGADTGIVQGNCLCAFTGAPHPQISATVTGTL